MRRSQKIWILERMRRSEKFWIVYKIKDKDGNFRVKDA